MVVRYSVFHLLIVGQNLSFKFRLNTPISNFKILLFNRVFAVAYPVLAIMGLLPFAKTFFG